MHVYTGRQCNQPMGLQSGRLKNHLVTASSQWDKYHAAFLARLHWQRRGRYMGAWSARHNNRYQWLQLDFSRWAKIIRLATQGRQDTDQWVTQYYVRHSLDGIRFVDYQERNTRKVSTQYQGSVKRLGKLWNGIGVKNTVTRCLFLLVYSLCRLADLSCRLVKLLYSLITSTEDDRLRRQDDKTSRQDYVSSTQDDRSKRQDYRRKYSRRQIEKTRRQDKYTRRQIKKTRRHNSRQYDIQNRHRLIFYPDTAP